MLICLVYGFNERMHKRQRVRCVIGSYVVCDFLATGRVDSVWMPGTTMINPNTWYVAESESLFRSLPVLSSNIWGFSR